MAYLTITEKILGIRRAGFVVMTRAEFDARFPGFLTEPSKFVLHSDEWMFDGKPDEGMTAYGDDAVLLEASFAEEYFEDEEMLDGVPFEAIEHALNEFIASKRRSHLKVVK